MGMTTVFRLFSRKWFIGLAVALCLMGHAQAENYLLVASKDIAPEAIEQSEIPRLMGLLKTQLNNREVKIAIRSERDVSDQFLQANLKTSWFGYLDRVNKLFFQQRITSLPPILSLQEFLVSITFDSKLVTYISEKEFRSLSLPEGVTAIPITGVDTKG